MLRLAARRSCGGGGGAVRVQTALVCVGQVRVPVRGLSLFSRTRWRDRVRKKDTIVERVDNKVRSRIWEKPPHHDALVMIPTEHHLRFDEPPEIVFPEDELFRTFLKRNPMFHFEKHAVVADEGRSIAQQFAQDQLAMMEDEGKEEEEAYQACLAKYADAIKAFEEVVQEHAHEDEATFATSWRNRIRQHYELRQAMRRAGAGMEVTEEDLYQDIVGLRDRKIEFEQAVRHHRNHMRDVNRDRRRRGLPPLPEQPTLPFSHREKEESRVLLERLLAPRVALMQALDEKLARQLQHDVIDARDRDLARALGVKDLSTEQLVLEDEHALPVAYPRAPDALVDAGLDDLSDGPALKGKPVPFVNLPDPTASVEEALERATQQFPLPADVQAALILRRLTPRNQDRVYEAIATANRQLVHHVRLALTSAGDKSESRQELERLQAQEKQEAAAAASASSEADADDPFGDLDFGSDEMSSEMANAASSDLLGPSAAQVDESVPEDAELPAAVGEAIPAIFRAEASVVGVRYAIANNEPVEQVEENIIGYNLQREPVFIGDRTKETPPTPHSSRSQDIYAAYQRSTDFTLRPTNSRFRVSAGERVYGDDFAMVRELAAFAESRQRVQQRLSRDDDKKDN